jgi:rhodanese-related sulfurtransferase
VQVAEAKAWAKALWLDARPAEDFSAGHIPGALPLRPGHWDSDFPAVLDAWQPDSKIVIYCGPECDSSEDAAKRLIRDTEWTDVFVLEGGWDAWRASLH